MYVDWKFDIQVSISLIKENKVRKRLLKMLILVFLESITDLYFLFRNIYAVVGDRW